MLLKKWFQKYGVTLETEVTAAVNSALLSHQNKLHFNNIIENCSFKMQHFTHFFTVFSKNQCSLLDLI